MSMTLKFSDLISCLLIFFLFCQCRSGEVNPPEAFLAFPIDTTVTILHSLPTKVKESSGIIVLNNTVWTHNDSGDYPQLYDVSLETGETSKMVRLKNADAKDWEDIAADDNFVYVGDFGNNGGRRQDLAIYKIPKHELKEGQENIGSVKLNYTYPDRTNFKPAKYQHNFDCEALISDGDSLFIFSKNHLDKHTRLYSLSKTASNQIAQLKQRFDTKGTVTGGGIDTKNNILALVGYYFDTEGGGYAPFVWFFWDYPNHDYFSGKSRRVNLPVLAQVEGICYWKEDKFLISSEKTSFLSGKLMVIEAGKWLD